jgi:D-amino-acid dehydrogenase
MRFSALDSNGIVALEPSLEDVRHDLVAGIHFVDDEFGDARQFCTELAGSIVASGGTIDTDTQVTEILASRGRVTGLRTHREVISADRVVLAAGPWSRRLSKPLGLSLPVQPAKGYSVTIDITGLDGAPRIPVLDDTMHAGVTPLDHRLRLVGTAEFTGFDSRVQQLRVDNLFDLLQALFPKIDARVDRAKARPWAGLRPMSADGKPVIGRTPVEGLYLNTGHGQLGWTMAAGSAEVLADLMQGTTPAIDTTPFALAGR